MRRYDAAGCAVADVLLPRSDVDLEKWAVVACDQFTSQPEYWHEVEGLVGDAPSTLKLIFPEVYLGDAGAAERIAAIRSEMQRYVDDGVLQAREGLVYLEREAAGRVRKGLMLAIDLEQYDYNKGSESLVRATEGTIVDRLPPRMKIREGAPLELPHIMVLIDDPEDRVIGPLGLAKEKLELVYDVSLMFDSGRVTGYGVADRSIEEATMTALAGLGRREVFEAKYGLQGRDLPVLLYAMGDGNHSLATAKAIWEKLKEEAEDRAALLAGSPARYALVEIVNVHDEALEFEPIHRVVFDLQRDLFEELGRHFADRCDLAVVESLEAMQASVDAVPEAGVHRFGAVRGDTFEVVTVKQPAANLAVGTLQEFLDQFMASGGAGELDYVHGTDPVRDLGRRPGNVGFYLPAMSKADLFKSVILDGALPRKTFSMGEASEKRFYLECRGLGEG